MPFIPARPPIALRVWPTDGNIDGDDQLAIADDHDREDPINTGESSVFLPTPPRANKAQLIVILFAYRIICEPGPLPAAARGLTLAGGVCWLWRVFWRLVC